MPLDDLVDVRFGHTTVEHAVRPDRNGDPAMTKVLAARGHDANAPVQAAITHGALEPCLEGFRALLRAAALRISIRSSVDAYENVTVTPRHRRGENSIAIFLP